MDEGKALEAGEVCWNYHLSGIVELVEIVANPGTRLGFGVDIKHVTGFKKGESDTVHADRLFRYPEEKELLAGLIASDISYLKSQTGRVMTGERPV